MSSPAKKESAAKPRGPYGQRASKSHDGLLREEIERVAKLSVRERMIEALDLGEELEAMLPEPRPRGATGTEDTAR